MVCPVDRVTKRVMCQNKVYRHQQRHGQIDAGYDVRKTSNLIRPRNVEALDDAQYLHKAAAILCVSDVHGMVVQAQLWFT